MKCAWTLRPAGEVGGQACGPILLGLGCGLAGLEAALGGALYSKTAVPRGLRHAPFCICNAGSIPAQNQPCLRSIFADSAFQ